MTKPAIIRTLTLFSLLLFVACGEKETMIDVQSIAISQPSAEMQISETLALKATVSPSNASYDGITWTSTNPNVASVSASGLVTAISEGNTTITVMAGGKTASCAITVVKGFVAVTSINLNKTSLEMVEGDSESLTATVLPNDATDKTVTWTSSNEGVATVQDGTVTAIKEGEATVTAMSGGINATCRIIVEKNNVPDAVDLGLSIKWASFNLGASKPEEFGNQYAFGEIAPKDEYTYTNYKWRDPSLEEGAIGYIKYGPSGESYLELDDDAATAVLGDKWRTPSKYELFELCDSCTWTWVEENQMMGYRVTSNINGETIFLPCALPGTPSYSIWAYYSSATNLYAISLDADGVSRIVSSFPYLDYYIRPVYGERVHVTSISLDSDSVSIKEGESYFTHVRVIPENAGDPSFSISSSDPSIVSLGWDGGTGYYFNGRAVGKATITVTTNDGGLEARCEVEVKTRYPAPDAIDMGLSVKWASFNLGASTVSECGDYFRWGELERLTSNNQNNTYTIADTYYSTGKTILESRDDAAYVLLGDGWRLPTREEVIELADNCTISEATYQGINGFRLQSNINGNTLFIPSAGMYNMAGSLEDGFYWTSTLTGKMPKSWGCDMVYVIGWWTSIAGYNGCSIRPVYAE